MKESSLKKMLKSSKRKNNKKNDKLKYNCKSKEYNWRI